MDENVAQQIARQIDIYLKKLFAQGGFAGNAYVILMQILLLSTVLSIPLFLLWVVLRILKYFKSTFLMTINIIQTVSGVIVIINALNYCLPGWHTSPLISKAILIAEKVFAGGFDLMMVMALKWNESFESWRSMSNTHSDEL